MSAMADWYMGVTWGEMPSPEEFEQETFEEVMHAKIKELVEEIAPRQVNAICPMQLMSQMNEAMSKESVFFGQVLNIRGIFKPGNGVLYGSYYYDNLKDENTNTQIKFLVPAAIRNRMKPDSLVIARGMVCKRIDALKSSIELQFRVDSIVEEVKEQAIDKDEVKRMELRQRKVAAGFKNVDSMLENMLMKGERPRVALVLPTTNVVLKDFEHGKRAASVAIDFVDRTVTFTHTSDLCNVLRTLDGLGFNAIALVRGGGIDPKTDVDKPEVIETVVGMKTPFISGLGHAPEIIFLRQVADKWTPNPNALGQYFAEIVEKASEKRTNSRAALVKEVEGQFKNQIQEQSKQLTNLQEQLKKQADSLKAQTESLTKLQTTNNELNKSVQQLTVKHSLAEKERDFAKEKVEQLEGKLKESKSSKIWMYVILVILALFAGFVIARMMFPSDY